MLGGRGADHTDHFWHHPLASILSPAVIVWKVVHWVDIIYLTTTYSLAISPLEPPDGDVGVMHWGHEREKKREIDLVHSSLSYSMYRMRK